AHLLRADHPAREFGGQRRLPLAALSAQHGVTRVAVLPQEALQGEQLAAATDEARLRLRRQCAEARGARLLDIFLRLLRVRSSEELRILFLLEEDGHEPVLELQLARAEDAAAEGVEL